ncbi:unnamed protein product [Citrullus colocynthis]|uniref:Uncharacterized protein n=1 Tax=Citrullus colocynthis TaxID=252529 RepID=A0ABP0Y9I7_9ROSI
MTAVFMLRLGLRESSSGWGVTNMPVFERTASIVRMATMTLNRLTSIYRVRYFDGDVLDKEQGDLARHKDVPIEPDVQNEYPTTPARQNVHNQYLTYRHHSDGIQFTDEGQPSSIRGCGDRGHYVTKQGRLRRKRRSSSRQK